MDLVAFNPHCLVAGAEMLVTAGRQHVRFWVLHPAGGTSAAAGGGGARADEAGGVGAGAAAGGGAVYSGAWGEAEPAVWDMAVRQLPGEKRRFGVSMREAGSAKYQTEVKKGAE